jgi:site-specific recombinase XerD
MGKISDNKPAASCTGCFAWGQLPGRFCRGCYTYGQLHQVGCCVGCRRQVPVDAKHGYCRLCRAQATWAIKASGTASVLEPYLRQVRHQQLFFANLQRPRNRGPRVGKQGRRARRRALVPDPPRVITGWVQLSLFTAARDFRRFDRERHADLANPWLVRARQTARALGEARGWSRWIASDVDRALVIVLSGYCEGESIRYSELFPALRGRGLPIVRTAEVLDRLGLFTDDRVPAVDRWLERKLDGVAQGIRREVEAWVRTLLDGGPRSEPRARHTAWAYLGEIRPVLLKWTSRYDHLREVTREDIVAARDAVTGKQRESRIVALRSLFRHAKRNGQVFRNPTIRIRVPRQAGGVIQVLDQADIDEAIATATTPDIRLILALAAVHAARPKVIRTMQLEDVDLGNRRITVGGHVRPLDEFTRRAVLDWLKARRHRWPNTANPHLLITQKTAVELGPAGKLWTTRATRNLTATLERLRVDRQLEEALTHGADPLHLALVFGIDDKTAIRYADSARRLLQTDLETDPACSPRTHGSVPENDGIGPSGSR